MREVLYVAPVYELREYEHHSHLIISKSCYSDEKIASFDDGTETTEYLTISRRRRGDYKTIGL